MTYQKIIRKGKVEGIAEGEAKEARRMVLLLGRRRLGEPSAEVIAALDALSDVQQLEGLSLRLLDAASWQELLS